MARRTGTFCFTDIEGSTRRWEQDRLGMERGLAEHDRIVRVIADRHGGTVFAHTGDGVAVSFDDVDESILFAVDLERAVASLALDVRVALHSGSAEERDGNWFGPTLNRCARLCAAGHGGQVLLSDAVAAMVQESLPETISLRSLGTHRLKDLREAEGVWQLEAAGLERAFPPLRSLHAAAHNLPIEMSSFFGRQEELATIANALKRHRLVTLTGPGGIGKTRLALHAGADAIDQFRDGAWLVELAPIASGSDVADGVLRALNFRRSGGGSATDSVTDGLLGRELLLILDNCEHVVDASAELAAAILRRCGEVQLLVTSREPLGIAGEHVEKVSPLDADAIDLFIDRAADAGAPLSDSDRAVAAQICERLDAMPLAVELAAARTASLSPSDILGRLDDPLRLLSATRRASSARHASVRATLAWSLALLSDGERDLFDRLSVFAGGIPLDGAAAVAPDLDALELMGSLVAKSMLSASRMPDGSTRYRMLETVRQLGAEALRERGLTNEVLRLHAHWCADLCTAIRNGLVGMEEPRWIDRLDSEFDNLRVGMGWCLAHEDFLALQIVGNLADLALHKLSAEIWDWAERALAIPGARDEPLAIEAHFLASHRCFQTREWDLALAHADEIHRLAEATGLPGAFWEETARQNTLSMAGRLPETRPLSRRAKAEAPQAWAGWVAWGMSSAYRFGLGRLSDEFEPLIAEIERTGNVTSRALAAQALSYLAFPDPDHRSDPRFGDVAELNQRALDLGRSVGHDMVIGHALLLRFGIRALLEGDLTGALEVADEVLDHWGRSGDELQGPNAIALVTRLLTALGRWDLVLVRDAFGQSFPEPWWPALVGDAHAQVTSARAADLSSMGASMSWAHLRVYAQSEIRAALAELRAEEAASAEE